MKKTTLAVIVAIITIIISGVTYAIQTFKASENVNIEAATAQPTEEDGQTDDAPIGAPQGNIDPDGWAMSLENGETFGENHRVLSKGLPNLGNAPSEEEAWDLWNTWIDVIKTNPSVLAGNYRLLLGKDIDPNSLYTVDDDGNAWASSQAIQAVAEIRDQYGPATTRISFGEVPEGTGYNSGLSASGNVVQSKTVGIKGDRRALVVERSVDQHVDGDGNVVTTIYVLTRCGNAVTRNVSQYVIPGPTDNPGSVHITVHKRWKGDAGKESVRPKIDFGLLRDGEEIRRGTLTADGGWSTFLGSYPEKAPDGHVYNYTVIEHTGVAGYASEGVTVQKSGNDYLFVITNRYDNPDSSTEPTQPTEPTEPTRPSRSTEEEKSPKLSKYGANPEVPSHPAPSHPADPADPSPQEPAPGGSKNTDPEKTGEPAITAPGDLRSSGTSKPDKPRTSFTPAGNGGVDRDINRDDTVNTGAEDVAEKSPSLSPGTQSQDNYRPENVASDNHVTNEISEDD